MINKILECKNLTKVINKKIILDNVSFDIEYGDILGFIGPNGAGKTTTIKLILGLQKMTSGEVKIDGLDITRNFVKSIEKVGAIIESPDMYMYLSGLENLEYTAELYKGISKEKIEEIVKLVGLEKRINDKVSTYSLGMRQRLGIAQALLNNPKLLILDEPTNGLDPQGIVEIRNLLNELIKDKQMAILISSHNLAELENCCNKICIIQNGRVVENALINELKDTYIKNSYVVEIDSLDKINKLSFEYEVVDNTHIKFSMNKENIPEIIKELENKNIKIYEVKKENESLEDIFIQKTGGNKIE